MGDGPRGIQVFPDYFVASTSGSDSPPSQASSASDLRSPSRSSARRRFRRATTMLNLFSLKGLSWKLIGNDQEKVVLSAVEVESLRSEIAALEERESHFKAQLEHVDEVLRSARLSGYLFLRTRWAALPGEPPPIDDTEVDDWLPRFVVLHGSCIYLYMIATDLSPQDSTLLSDVVEVGALPCLTREDDETRYCFYILTCHGLRYECSSPSKIQIDSWLAALRIDCKLASRSEDPKEPEKM
ncbi:Pleckstrin homology (PH) domain-containing protein [Striga hermonthica]|uniref:Pleckstrin homology (PH) domain-containing protein n=1 Tax=Striga hermonthica TaxID=68872 RepID=A0A9N7R3Q1_STRHE|nr:Pleckstrin homology (PH) domain-containing protein [Striga hermonthica]